MKILYTPEILSCFYLSWFESESISCWGISELPRFWTRISVSFRFLFSTSSTLSSTPLPPPPPPTSSSSNTASQLGSDFRNLKNIIIYILGAQLNLILVKPFGSKRVTFPSLMASFWSQKSFSWFQSIFFFIPTSYFVIYSSFDHCDFTFKFPSS